MAHGQAMRTIKLLTALLSAIIVGACSGQSRLPDRANWSLAEKPPVSLGGPGTATTPEGHRSTNIGAAAIL